MQMAKSWLVVLIWEICVRIQLQLSCFCLISLCTSFIVLSANFFSIKSPQKATQKCVFYVYRMSWRVSQLKILWADPRCTGLRWVRLLERRCTVMTYHTPMVNFSSQSWQAPDHMPKSRKMHADSLTVLTLKKVRNLCVQSFEWMNEWIFIYISAN